MSMVMLRPRNSDAIGLIPRAARVSLRYPLIFSCVEGRIAGYSTNMSESGVLGTFQEPLDVWLTGQLTIQIPDLRPIVVDARIARVDGRTAALCFANLSAYDRTKLQSVIEEAIKDQGAA